MTENPLINIGELSKPATVLIEKISDAVGGIFEPYQIKRVAKAEAEAKIIEAKAEIEVTEMQRRAFKRFLKEEERKQRNIEEITQKALPQLNENAQSDKMEEDWIANFFDKSKLISNNEMQDLWARILAGEANKPGTYSKRTISLLSNLDKNDADIFTSLCGFVWQIGELTPLIYDVNNDIYTSHKINFSSLIHLESIGLIQFDNLGGYRKIGLPKKFTVIYYGIPLALDLPKDKENELKIGKVLLTKVGQELARICGSQPIEGFFEYILVEWGKMNYLGNKEEKKARPNEFNADA